MVQLAVMLWFYATPVIYALNLCQNLYNHFFYLNPMTAIIEFISLCVMGLPITLN
jgi:ABC-type polysaccharide/polyol phosphate export permease